MQRSLTVLKGSVFSSSNAFHPAERTSMSHNKNEGYSNVKIPSQPLCQWRRQVTKDLEQTWVPSEDMAGRHLCFFYNYCRQETYLKNQLSWIIKCPNKLDLNILHTETTTILLPFNSAQQRVKETVSALHVRATCISLC